MTDNPSHYSSTSSPVELSETPKFEFLYRDQNPESEVFRRATDTFEFDPRFGAYVCGLLIRCHFASFDLRGRELEFEILCIDAEVFERVDTTVEFRGPAKTDGMDIIGW